MAHRVKPKRESGWCRERRLCVCVCLSTGERPPRRDGGSRRTRAGQGGTERRQRADLLVDEALELLVLFVDGELRVQVAAQLPVAVNLKSGVRQLKRSRGNWSGRVRPGQVESGQLEARDL